jgi:spermidine synthase
LRDFPVLKVRRELSVDTGWQKVDVWRSPSVCEFRVAGALHAWWHRERFLTGLAWDNLAAAALLRPGGAPESVLLLGVAGGTVLRVLRHLLPETRFTAVEIDAGIVALARRHMNLDACGAEIHIADAYSWIGQCDDRFDVVMDDCYLAGETDVYRPEKQPGRRLPDFHSLLAPGGLVLTNLITGSGHRTLQSRTRAAYKRQFKEVRSVTTPESMNETLAGGDAVLGAAALDRWSDSFPHRKDREFWRRLTVRKLR